MARTASIRFTHIALAVFAAFFFAACESKTPAVDEQAAAPAQRSIETIADEVLAAMLLRYPSMATSYSIAGARHDRLYDNSLEALADWHGREDAWLAELDAIGEPTDVGSRDWGTFGILHEQLAASQASRICRKELWETSTRTAWYGEMPFIFDIQPLESDDLKGQAWRAVAHFETVPEVYHFVIDKAVHLGQSRQSLFF